MDHFNAALVLILHFLMSHSQSATFVRNADCGRNLHSYVARCISHCLNLTRNNVEKPKCFFDPNIGVYAEKTNKTCSECLDYQANTEKFESFKRISRSSKNLIIKSSCGKRISLGSLAIGTDYEFSGHICDLAEPTLYHWNPQSVEEIKSIVEALRKSINIKIEYKLQFKFIVSKRVTIKVKGLFGCMRLKACAPIGSTSATKNRIHL
ncbi:uncharacterized protein LOC132205645 [Neocloeon triangulifer]|uniref:uncharacterized protein LOC132205645 n=1 Tax=Neocloeon triangulifer TaxID=2078957 RepID=UPI00286F97DB|nr:uncharacterized protein LOC132205645 [Neocloeon triangulifer]